MEGFGWYTYEIVKRWVAAHPEVEFFFFFDRPYDDRFVFGPHVTPIVLSPPARHPILFFVWNEWSVRRALKKYRIDLYFSPDGYLSLGSNCPQLAVIHDINFQHFPKDLPPFASSYLRFFFPRFARKAKHILTVSEFSKADIATTYEIPKDKISVVYNGVSPLFRPFADSEKETFKERVTSGRPYFFFVGSLQPRKNLHRLLRAYFTLLETKNIDFDLVIAGAAMWQRKNRLLIPDGWRQRVHFLGHLTQDDLVEAMACATVFVYVPYFEGFGIPLVEAMRCGVPIVCGNRTALPEVVEGAALLVDPFEVSDIARGMLELASNEQLQDQLRTAGFQRAQFFSWEQSAQQSWEVLQRIAEKE